MKRQHAAQWTAALLLAAALAAPVSGSAGWYLRADGGTVCIFDAATGHLAERTDTPVSSLQQADREALAAGVYCGTADELTRAREDFCS